MLNFFKNLSSTEVLVIALILIVFFGAGAIKKMGRISGESLKEMKKIKKNFNDAVEDSTEKE